MRIGIIGAGSWGTTLANLLAKKGFDISLWVYEKDLVASITEKRENSLYLPGIHLSDRIKPTSSLEEVCDRKELLINATPSQVVRQIMQKIRSYLPPHGMLVNASKGIENTTLLTMSGVIQETLALKNGNRFAVLSGPTFATEVSRETPTAVTLASENREGARELLVYPTDCLSDTTPVPP